MCDKSIVLVGCGNMGRAMLEGWISAQVVTAENVYVVEPNSHLHEKPRALGSHTVTQPAQLPQKLNPFFIIFAIKPQLFDAVVPAYTNYAQSSAFISVVAGVQSSRFERFLGARAALVRVMPNTPAAIGEGMLAFCDNGQASREQLEFAEKLLSASGMAVRVQESQMDAVTGISGSGPAYIFYMIECLTQAGIEIGLEPDIALALARQTVKGSGILAASSPEIPPAILREQVTSPNGTTAAGCQVLMKEERMQKMISECVRAARDRSIELGKRNS